MAYKVDNAVILAAGMSSRFSPLSYEYPKALLNVKGEILIERQIRQLQEAGVTMVENEEYEIRNNHSSIFAAKNYIKNSYICSADHYFCQNPFELQVEDPYYAAVYAYGVTNEWCLETDQDGWITNVTVGGSNQWYMMGHAFWNEEFSQRYISILENEYSRQTTKEKFWETIYQEHIGQLKLKMRKYPGNQIFEFDSLDELRKFDESYIMDTQSNIIKKIVNIIGCKEDELTDFLPVFSQSGCVSGVLFRYKKQMYHFIYEKEKLKKVLSEKIC